MSTSNLIPVGHYRGVAVPVNIDGAEFWAQFGETKAGAPQVAITFAILDGPHAGRRAPWFGSFSADAIKRTIESLRYCGFKGEELADLLTQKINQEVSITVEHNEWQGKVTAKVAWVNAAGGGGLKLAKPLAKDALRLFSAKMRMHVKGVAEVNAPAATAPTAALQAATPPPEPAAAAEDRGDDPWSGYAGGAAPSDDKIPF